MPTFTKQQLQAIIDEGRLRAITLDTNVYHRFGYNLTTTVLLSMAQFAARGVDHVVSEVVGCEVIAHMIEKEERVSGELKDALRRYAKARKQFDAEVTRVAPELGLEADIAEDVHRRWREFLTATNGIELQAGTLVNASRLSSLYFEVKPPFEASGDKKVEFPDAIALLELEGYGANKQGFVLAVSRDTGWADFAADAEWLIVADDLPAAVEMFHTADAAVADQAVALLADEESALHDDLYTAVRGFVDDLNPEIDAESHMELRAEFASAEIVQIEPIERESVRVIESDANTLTFAVEVRIALEIEAYFDFYAYDSIDNDYLGLGSSSASQQLVVPLPVTIVVPRGITEEAGALSIRLERLQPLTVGFGYVEPDGWRDEA